MLPRSAGLVAAVVGVLRAGAVYLPVDPDYPAERQAMLVTDSGAAVVVCCSATRRAAHAAGAASRIIDLDDDADWISAFPDSAPSVQPPGSSAAYVIYTSGSTGRPKGVVVEHANLDHLARFMSGFADLTCHDRVFMYASPSFDASVFEIVMALANHATLVVAQIGSPNDESALEQIDRCAVTVATLPAFLLDVSPARSLRALRVLISAAKPAA